MSKKRKIRIFRPVYRVSYPSLFDEWRATARKGLPNRWLHPIKYHYWQKWNLLTHGRGTREAPVKLNFGTPSRDVPLRAPRRLGSFDRKPATAASLKKLDKLSYDTAVFL